jgi:hypothetical protein
VGLGLGIAHTRLAPPAAPGLARIVQLSSAVSNCGNVPLVLVLSLLKSPALPFHTAAHADAAVCYGMLGLAYAQIVQMPLGACA